MSGKNFEQIKIVIFDLDGTLVNLPIDYEKLRNEIAGILKVRRVNSILNTLLNINEESRAEIFKILDAYELNAIKNMREIAEGIKIYNDSRNKVRCLVTLQGELAVKEIMRVAGLSFDVIITREFSLDRYEQIKAVIERFNVSPGEVLFVGDRETDEKAAKKIGCNFILIKGMNDGRK
ncbi:MAG: HAD-IA family hydrolase [Candidatus Bathyarchaeia archaeon]